MRCLTLAAALRDLGYGCDFISRELPGHLINEIVARGFPVHRLPKPNNNGTSTGGLAHAQWLGVPWEVDALESKAILAALVPQLVVCDHYSIDLRWQLEAMPLGVRLVVIDDLADRQHNCDLLIDQNLGRCEKDYDGLVPTHCNRLIGPKYALLRTEFTSQRKASLARRPARQIRHILISMGGVDRPNVTSMVLKALKDSCLPETCQIKVVLGKGAPWLDEVRKQAAVMRGSVAVHENVSDMASLMASADIAIGGAGSTSWERCCLGLPSLLVVMADNQVEAAHAMDKQGVAINLGRYEEPRFKESLQLALLRLSNREHLSSMIDASQRLTDGNGATRVSSRIRELHST